MRGEAVRAVNYLCSLHCAPGGRKYVGMLCFCVIADGGDWRRRLDGKAIRILLQEMREYLRDQPVGPQSAGSSLLNSTDYIAKVVFLPCRS